MTSAQHLVTPLPVGAAVAPGTLRARLEELRARGTQLNLKQAVGIVVPLCVQAAELHRAGQQLYLADWRGWHSETGALVGGDVIDGHLDELRNFFDMVIMVAPPADVDPLATILARYADGNVIVLEAEQTRRAAAIRLREVLARSGSPIVGTILNNRRNYLPRWLARLL